MSAVSKVSDGRVDGITVLSELCGIKRLVLISGPGEAGVRVPDVEASAPPIKGPGKSSEF